MIYKQLKLKIMQSVNRAIKRGNAVIYFDTVLKRHEVVRKHGTPLKFWKFAVKNQITNL